MSRLAVLKSVGVKMLEYIGWSDSPGSFRVFESWRQAMAATFLFACTVTAVKLAAVFHIW